VNNLVHVSKLKEHVGNDDFKASFRRTAEWR